jgi:hypothetical protein
METFIPWPACEFGKISIVVATEDSGHAYFRAMRMAR